MKVQDYYQILGVARDASAQDIQRAYRKQARLFHPDVNKAADAAEKFSRLNEAYEVLKDPDKRKRYDQFGANWKGGEEFTPPPGYENFHFRQGAPESGPGNGPGGFRFRTSTSGNGGPGGFSDFFEMLFGNPNVNMEDLFAQMQGGHQGFTGRQAHTHHAQPAEQETELAITLEEAFHGSTRQLTLSGPEGRKRVDVRIPAGSSNGSRIRLRGENLLLRLRLQPHDRYSVEGHDLTVEVPIETWQAALGDKIQIATLDGPVTLTIPACTSSGARLRLRGKGLPKRGGERGDLFARLKIVIPKNLTDEQRKLYEQLKDSVNERNS
ncbi:MAG: DnaJ domain-containing protein [Phycisphaeraceae bacterium]|nr:DnaJ domain-containing protein [Phycisphaeraceae bacterium]